MTDEVTATAAFLDFTAFILLLGSFGFHLLSVSLRDVTDSGLESAPEYEFGSLASIFKSDSGSGSF